MPSIDATLLSGRSLQQGRTKELGKFSAEYAQNLAICEMDPVDMKTLGVSDGETVLVETSEGGVVLKAIKSSQGPHVGIIFVPYGPWANILTYPKTDGTGMPTLKGIKAKISPAEDQQTMSFPEIIDRLLGKKKG